MKWLKRIFNFYIDASIHVALSVLALFYCTCYFTGISVEIHAAFFVFFGTVSCYNFIKYGVEAKKYILVASRYHKNIQFVSILALIITAYHISFFNKEQWLLLGVMAILTGLYALPVLPKSKNFRSLGVFKIFMVAMVWAGITVVLPVQAFGQKLGWDIWIEVFQRFLLVLILLLPFEIRDLRYDAHDLGTLPQRIGVLRTKVFGAVSLILFMVSIFLIDDLSLLEIIAKGILVLVLGIMLWKTKTNQKKYFSSFWVEAIPIFWMGLIWLLKETI